MRCHRGLAADGRLGSARKGLCRGRRDDDEVLALGAENLPASVAVIAAEPLRTVRASELEIAHDSLGRSLDSIVFTAKGCGLFSSSC